MEPRPCVPLGGLVARGTLAAVAHAGPFVRGSLAADRLLLGSTPLRAACPCAPWAVRVLVPGAASRRARSRITALYSFGQPPSGPQFQPAPVAPYPAGPLYPAQDPARLAGYQAYPPAAPAALGEAAVFWDFENCPIPWSLDCGSVSRRLRDYAKQYGCVRALKAYAKTDVLMSRMSELLNNGVEVVPVAAGKEMADKAIITDVLLFVLDTVQRSSQCDRVPCTIIIVSGDGGFAPLLAKLSVRGIRTVIVGPRKMLPGLGKPRKGFGNPLSLPLMHGADFTADWNDILGPRITEEEDEQAAAESAGAAGGAAAASPVVRRRRLRRAEDVEERRDWEERSSSSSLRDAEEEGGDEDSTWKKKWEEELLVERGRMEERARAQEIAKAEARGRSEVLSRLALRGIAADLQKLAASSADVDADVVGSDSLEPSREEMRGPAGAGNGAAVARPGLPLPAPSGSGGVGISESEDDAEDEDEEEEEDEDEDDEDDAERDIARVRERAFSTRSADELGVLRMHHTVRMLLAQQGPMALASLPTAWKKLLRTPLRLGDYRFGHLMHLARSVVDAGIATFGTSTAAQGRGPQSTDEEEAEEEKRDQDGPAEEKDLGDGTTAEPSRDEDLDGRYIPSGTSPSDVVLSFAPSRRNARLLSLVQSGIRRCILDVLQDPTLGGARAGEFRPGSVPLQHLGPLLWHATGVSLGDLLKMSGYGRDRLKEQSRKARLIGLLADMPDIVRLRRAHKEILVCVVPGATQDPECSEWAVKNAPAWDGSVFQLVAAQREGQQDASAQHKGQAATAVALAPAVAGGRDGGGGSEGESTLQKAAETRATSAKAQKRKATEAEEEEDEEGDDEDDEEGEGEDEEEGDEGEEEEEGGYHSDSYDGGSEEEWTGRHHFEDENEHPHFEERALPRLDAISAVYDQEDLEFDPEADSDFDVDEFEIAEDGDSDALGDIVRKLRGEGWDVEAREEGASAVEDEDEGEEEDELEWAGLGHAPGVGHLHFEERALPRLAKYSAEYDRDELEFNPEADSDFEVDEFELERAQEGGGSEDLMVSITQKLKGSALLDAGALSEAEPGAEALAARAAVAAEGMQASEEGTEDKAKKEAAVEPADADTEWESLPVWMDALDAADPDVSSTLMLESDSEEAFPRSDHDGYDSGPGPMAAALPLHPGVPDSDPPAALATPSGAADALAQSGAGAGDSLAPAAHRSADGAEPAVDFFAAGSGTGYSSDDDLFWEAPYYDSEEEREIQREQQLPEEPAPAGMDGGGDEHAGPGTLEVDPALMAAEVERNERLAAALGAAWPVLGVSPGWAQYSELSSPQRMRLQNHMRALLCSPAAEHVGQSAGHPGVPLEAFARLYAAAVQKAVAELDAQNLQARVGQPGAGEANAGPILEHLTADSSGFLRLLRVALAQALPAMPHVVQPSALHQEGVVVLSENAKNCRITKGIRSGLRGLVLQALALSAEGAGLTRSQVLARLEELSGKPGEQILADHGYATGERGMRLLINDMADILDMRWEVQPPSEPAPGMLHDPGAGREGGPEGTASVELAYLQEGSGAASLETHVLHSLEPVPAAGNSSLQDGNPSEPISPAGEGL